jgi:hypothetical protein
MTMSLSRFLFSARRSWLAVAAVVPLAAVSVLAAVSAPASAAPGCSVAYTSPSQWQGGFTANVVITNVGDAVDGWTLTWSFGAGQKVEQAWSAEASQSGAQVTARNVSYNASIPAGGSVSFGFNGSMTGTDNPAPESFTARSAPVAQRPPRRPRPRPSPRRPTSSRRRATCPAASAGRRVAS